MPTSTSFLAISRAHWLRKARALAVLGITVGLLYGQAQWPQVLLTAGA